METNQTCNTESLASEETTEEITDARSEALPEQPLEQTDEALQQAQMELARVTEEARTYQDRWIRLAAEFENYKKRTSREFGTLIKNANEALIVQILPTLDSFERALQSARTSGEFEPFYRGVEMIYQQLLEALRREGLRELAAVGQPFDPMKHEAVLAVERPDQSPDTVVEEIEKGYLLNEKVIRPAKVVVSRLPEQVSSTDDGTAS